MIGKMPIGGTVYVELVEDNETKYEKVKETIAKIMIAAKNIFTRQGVSLSVIFIFSPSDKVELLSHNVYISNTGSTETSLGSGQTGHFNSSSVNLKLGLIDTDAEIKFADRVMAHEILHGYASKLGYLLFGTSRYFQPDNDVPAVKDNEPVILNDNGHLVYKNQQDVGNTKKIYPNLLLGHDVVEHFKINVESATEIDKRLLPLLKNRFKYFNINDLDTALRQYLGSDLVKWDIFYKRLQAILKREQDDFDTDVKYNLRTSDASQFNFNVIYDK